MGRNCTFCFCDVLRSKSGVRWQIEIAFQAAQFDGCEAVLLGKVQNLAQVPDRAAQG